MNTVTKPSYAELLNALNAVLPYAISRAEDMHAAGGNSCSYWQKADAAIENANELLERFAEAAKVPLLDRINAGREVSI